MPQLIDFKEGAKELKVSIHTLRGWANKRRIPYVRLGRRVLLKREDLEASSTTMWSRPERIWNNEHSGR